MLVKTKIPAPSKPKPVCGQSNNKVVQPIRCTPGGDVMVHQTNQPVPVGNGVNRKNKDGVLTLGDDGRYLRNYRVEPDGTTVVTVRDPVDVKLPPVIEVKGTVDIGNSLTVKPIMVLNVPEEIKVQEGLNVVQTSRKAKVVPFSFEGREYVVLTRPCRIYSIHLTVCDPTWIEISHVTGEMFTKEIKIDLFPLYIQLEELVIKVREWSKVGGYAIYEA